MNFAKKVLKVVSKIPRGEVMTYAQVAKAVGRPRAYRAVGNILHRNPRPMIYRDRISGTPESRSPRHLEIPCHRVVKSDGKIGGYVYGVAKKRALLHKEGIKI